MKILITGGTGFVGKALVKKLLAQGHELTLLTRGATFADGDNRHVRVVPWNPDHVDVFIPEVNGQDVVINLAGSPILEKRWTEEEKKKIGMSRVQATRKIVHSIEKSKIRPRVLINASAIGYYGSCGDREISEEAAHGFDFLSQVAHAWEREAHHAENFGVRVVRLRFGIVLEKSGGVLAKLIPVFRNFFGASFGNGRQWMSWIHLDDLISFIEFCIHNENISGPINAVSPNPVTNRDFSKSLAKALRRPCWFSVPEIVLKTVLGEMSSVFLSSCRASQQKIESLGFSFRHPDLESALL